MTSLYRITSDDNSSHSSCGFYSLGNDKRVRINNEDDDDDNDSDVSELTRNDKGKPRGKAKPWTRARVFKTSDLLEEKGKKANTFTMSRNIKGKIEYTCKHDSCNFQVRFMLMETSVSSFWEVCTLGTHKHTTIDGEPWTSDAEDWINDDDDVERGLTEVELKFLEAVIEELGVPRTTAFQDVKSLWLSKFDDYNRVRGEYVPPFPCERKIKYRLVNRLRSIPHDETLEFLQEYVLEHIREESLSDNRYQRTRASLLSSTITNDSQLVRYYRHREVVDGRVCWILCYSTKMLVESYYDCVRVVASDGSYGSVKMF